MEPQAIAWGFVLLGFALLGFACFVWLAVRSATFQAALHLVGQMSFAGLEKPQSVNQSMRQQKAPMSLLADIDAKCVSCLRTY